MRPCALCAHCAPETEEPAAQRRPARHAAGKMARGIFPRAVAREGRLVSQRNPSTERPCTVASPSFTSARPQVADRRSKATLTSTTWRRAAAGA